MKRRPAVAVFVKTPGLSPVKTRLGATLGQDAAIEFYRLSCAAIQQTLVGINGQDEVELDFYWAIAEPDALLHKHYWATFSLINQGEGGLGERLAKVYTELLVRHSAVFLIGADAPQITAEHFQEARKLLQKSDFVVGAAEDGGFYIFGGRTPIPQDVWTSIPYSTNQTGLELQKQLRLLGVVAILSATLRDVDDETDLIALAKQLERCNKNAAQTALLDWCKTRKLGELPKSVGED